jgi:DNA-binding CsgD family transcriptional regulator
MTTPIKTGYHIKRRPKRTPAPLGLTHAEWRIVKLMAAGHTRSAQLAEVIVCAKRTVDHHIGQIYCKLDVSDVAGIVLCVLNDDNARRLCWPGLRIEEVAE